LREGTGAGVYGQSAARRLSFSLGRYATVFQVEICAILASAYEIQSQNRPEKYVSICSDSLVALKALKVIRTTSSLVHQCQKALNGISIRHAIGLFWSPDMLEYEVIKSPIDSRGAALLRGFLGPSRPWLSLGENYKRGSVSDWPNGTRLNGEFLVIPKGRLENLSRDFVRVTGQNL